MGGGGEGDVVVGYCSDDGDCSSDGIRIVVMVMVVVIIAKATVTAMVVKSPTRSRIAKIRVAAHWC